MAIIFVNGINLYYREAGSGEPLILVHGTGFTADIWNEIFDDLACKYHIIAYDRRAYQRSQGNPSPVVHYGFQQGEDLVALLQAVGATPANILGWSAGGIFALHAAISHPDLIKRLILYEPPIFLMRYLDFPFLKGLIKTALLTALGKKEAAVDSFMRMVMAYQDGRNSHDMLDTDSRTQLTKDTNITLAEFWAMPRDDLKPKLLNAQINVPVSILSGDQSPAPLKKAAENLARILHNSPVIHISASNHFAQVDRPDRFVKALEEAMARR